MEELVSVLQALLFQPAVAIPVACVALTALLRSFIGAKWPHFEESDWYKFTLSAAQIAFGIILAVGCRLAGLANGKDGEPLGWAYVIIVGIVAGFASSWLWSVIKAVAKKYLKLTDKDIQERKSRISLENGKKDK